MRNDEERSSSSQGVRGSGGGGGGGGGRLIPPSLRAYLRIMSSGASTVASSVRSAASAASAMVERETSNETSHAQVLWAGFDKLECEGNVTRQFLLLGYRYGFQVWDVEEANNVRNLVSRHDGPTSFMQLLPKPIASKRSGDEFADNRPLLVICVDGSFSGGGNIQDGFPTNGNIQNGCDQSNVGFLPNAVWFYSLKSQSYVHSLKFRSVVYSVRCSSQIIAILQAAQVHCFDAATLEKGYTILTNPIATSCLSFGSVGLGPLAVGPRWMAYSGSPVPMVNAVRVSPQHLTPGPSSSNGSVVAHYAKESSKQLAAGIVTLGGMGFEKISRFYSDGTNSQQSVNPVWKDSGAVNGLLVDADSVGMVIIRDVVSKSVISQFKAHKSPIASLCFDPSGTILVTASVQGHNINVFRVMPNSESGESYVHLYRLQRGFTNAVIQDISFSVDSHWIMITSSRGTSHLFGISPSGNYTNIQSADACFTPNISGYIANAQPVVGPLNSSPQLLSQQTIRSSGPPVTLAAVGRIRSGNSGWKNTVTGAAVAVAGKGSLFSGTIASAFHNCKGTDLYSDTEFSKVKSHVLVFSPSGSLIQYAWRLSLTPIPGLNTTYDSASESDSRFVAEAIQKWNICQKQNRREREDNFDIYGENVYSDNRKVYPEGTKKDTTVYAAGRSNITKKKISSEEKHNIHISDAELQMHQRRGALWSRPEVYFQSFIKDDIRLEEQDASGGEFEIESMSTRTVEARSKGLVPAVDFIQTPKFQMARNPGFDLGISGMIPRKPEVLEHGKLPCDDTSDSLASMSISVDALRELNNGPEGEASQNNNETTVENNKDNVNNDDSPTFDKRDEIVNKREISVRKHRQKVVNSN